MRVTRIASECTVELDIAEAEYGEVAELLSRARERGDVEQRQLPGNRWQVSVTFTNDPLGARSLLEKAEPFHAP